MCQLGIYLTFNGNCREAMTFYHRCFGGEIQFQTLGDSPLGSQLNPEMQSYILQASIKTHHFKLMGTDLVGEHSLVQGNSLSIWLECNTISEARYYYQRLAKNGDALQPLESTFSGSFLGSLTDQFGKQWLFHSRD